jgi:NAD-dependent dihydropyrimidine dehydrogenase PreA subunit
MATETCDGCGEHVRIAGGIADLWSFQNEPSGGMTLEFADGSECFLCFACIEQLPNDPTAADVNSL